MLSVECEWWVHMCSLYHPFFFCKYLEIFHIKNKLPIIYEWYSMMHAYEGNQKHSLWLLRSQPKIDHTEADLGTLDNRVKFLNPYTNRQASIPTRIRIIFNSLIINLIVILSKKKVYCLKESFLVNNMVEDTPGKKF